MPAENIARWLGRPLNPFAVGEVSELQACLGTTIGDVRTENQDRAVIARFLPSQRSRESFVCFAVCDGMGGMLDGARCAEIALSSFLSRLVYDQTGKVSEWVRRAALSANTEVYRQYRERGGTTLVAIVVIPGSAVAVSIGDSRIYSAGSKWDEIKQVSTDDTIAGELNKIREFHGSRSDEGGFATQLAQFVGIGEGMEPRIYPINTAQSHLLTSDGAHSLSAATFQEIATSAKTPQRIVWRLLQVSRWCGGSDNATAICVPTVRNDWLLRPKWSAGDWLEIWDAAGKLELTIPTGDSFPARQIEQTKAEESKTKRSRKRAGPTKKERRSVTAIGNSPSQGNLKIEIIDEEPRDASAKNAQPPSPESNQNSERDDVGGKRE